MLKLICILAATFFLGTALAQDVSDYKKKLYPNGDVEISYSSPDGAKIISLQHKDGSGETKTIAPDGTQANVIRHVDGSVQTNVTRP